MKHGVVSVSYFFTWWAVTDDKCITDSFLIMVPLKVTLSTRGSSGTFKFKRGWSVFRHADIYPGPGLSVYDQQRHPEYSEMLTFSFA
jgi:hypothetical protein